MSFWSSEKLEQRILLEGLICPFDSDRIKHGAYELSLGTEFFTTSDQKKHKMNSHEQIVIKPGQFGILLTGESITVPGDAIGFISIKAGIKFRGLVNVSGFHVDPGFSGYLKFSVYNAGSQNIVLKCGDPVFLMWYCDLDRLTGDKYSGNHAGQNEISPEDVMRIQGDVASPSSLNQRLKDVEGNIKTFKILILGVIVGLLVLYFWQHINYEKNVIKPAPGHVSESLMNQNESKSVRSSTTSNVVTVDNVKAKK
jgi:dCTP deaminase